MSDETIERVVEFSVDAMEEIKDIRSSLVRVDCALRSEGDMPLLYALPDIAAGVQSLANAITPTGVSPGVDANGGFVGSLTEAVMGCSSGLAAIANAINRLADAVEATNR